MQLGTVEERVNFINHVINVQKNDIDCQNFVAADYIRSILIHDSTIQEALFMLGFLYENGLGVDKDPKKAIQYYSQSGLPEALNKMGDIYFAGYLDMKSN